MTTNVTAMPTKPAPGLQQKADGQPVSKVANGQPASQMTAGTPVKAAAPTPPKASALPKVPPVPEKVDTTLAYILQQKRKFRSPGELAFMGWLADELKRRGAKPEIMSEGCLTVEIEYPSGVASDTLFSCHTDTVHSEESGTQNLVYDAAFGHIFLGKVKGAVTPGAHTNKMVKAATNADADGMVPSGSCLGSDDGAGIWLMLEMISAKVPGAYVFHRGEECGGVGARALAIEHKPWLERFSAAIAFDRPRTNEVIITQGGQECASKTYGTALASALNESEYLDYEISENGVYTDTKEYRKIIDECINLGVGYEHQHGVDEFLDYGHLVALRDRCLTLEWDKLPFTRDAFKAKDAWSGYQGKGWTGYDGRKYDGYQGSLSLEDWDDARHKPSSGATSKPAATSKPTPAVTPTLTLDYLDELRGMTRDMLVDAATADPDWVADALQSLAVKLVAANAVLDFLGVDL